MEVAILTVSSLISTGVFASISAFLIALDRFIVLRYKTKKLLQKEREALRLLENTGINMKSLYDELTDNVHESFIKYQSLPLQDIFSKQS